MGQALKKHCFASQLSYGTIERAADDHLLVVGPLGLITARRAASCLLAPGVRDTVLLGLLDDGTAWVLAVLTSQNSTPQTLCLPKKTSISAQSLDITAEKLTLSGQNLELSGESVGISSSLLTLGGKMLLQGFAVIKSLAHTLSERCARRLTHCDSLDEKVTELAKRRAGRSQLSVEHSLRVRSENADIRAREQVDIDGSHIKVG